MVITHSCNQLIFSLRLTCVLFVITQTHNNNNNNINIKTTIQIYANTNKNKNNRNSGTTNVKVYCKWANTTIGRELKISPTEY